MSKNVLFAKKNAKEQILCSFNAKNQEQTHIYNLYLAKKKYVSLQLLKCPC